MPAPVNDVKGKQQLNDQTHYSIWGINATCAYGVTKCASAHAKVDHARCEGVTFVCRMLKILSNPQGLNLPLTKRHRHQKHHIQQIWSILLVLSLIFFFYVNWTCLVF